REPVLAAGRDAAARAGPAPMPPPARAQAQSFPRTGRPIAEPWWLILGEPTAVLSSYLPRRAIIPEPPGADNAPNQDGRRETFLQRTENAAIPCGLLRTRTPQIRHS